jgi:hypothetical protein
LVIAWFQRPRLWPDGNLQHAIQLPAKQSMGIFHLTGREAVRSCTELLLREVQ